jgi:tryptophan synthase alpha chain
MRAAELDTVFLAAPTSPDERLKSICDSSSGFVYAVSRTGVTGTHQQVEGDARDLVSRIRRCTKLPIAVGFGISNAQQFSEVTSFADAAVIGSGIVQVIEKAGPGSQAASAVYEFITSLISGSRQTAQSTTK